MSRAREVVGRRLRFTVIGLGALLRRASGALLEIAPPIVEASVAGLVFLFDIAAQRTSSFAAPTRP